MFLLLYSVPPRQQPGEQYLSFTDYMVTLCLPVSKHRGQAALVCCRVAQGLRGECRQLSISHCRLLHFRTQMKLLTLPELHRRYKSLQVCKSVALKYIDICNDAHKMHWLLTPRFPSVSLVYVRPYL